jgi:hypothetical protein
MKLRKWNRILHRDLGYIFFGMSVIYGLSGIALNHLDDWNPDYIIRTHEIVLDEFPAPGAVSREQAKDLVEKLDNDYQYKSHFFPRENLLKIFLKQGSATINLESGRTYIEILKKRSVFHEVNFLHYNKPKKLWTWFSDAFAVALILMAFTGLFMIRGRKGISGRGAWLTAVGILIPVIFLLLWL